MTPPREPIDSYRLERFVAAQQGVYEAALRELLAGRKDGHWIWFIFPQVAGLGRSPLAHEYAIGSLDEARAYLDHPVLGPRLRECARALLRHTARTAEEILGGIDAVKVRSSMTLFHRADPAVPEFGDVLDAFYGGRADERTDEILAAAGA